MTASSPDTRIAEIRRRNAEFRAETGFVPDDGADAIDWLLDQLAAVPDQIARAVEAEREACAKMVEPHDEPATYSTLAGRFPSAAIRARGEAK